MRGSTSLTRLLLTMLPLFLPPTRAISPSARRVQTVFTFVISSQPLSNNSECASTINHKTILRYRGINPANPSEILDGILWKNLQVNNITCLSTPSANAATYFRDSPPSPPLTPTDSANPWFLTAIDNSPRLCLPFRQPYPGRYFFTDNMPRFRDRFQVSKMLPTTSLPPSLANALRGDIFMFSQLFDPDSGVRSATYCTYLAATPTPSPSPSPTPERRRRAVCFPAHATATTPHGTPIRMDHLQVGDMVQVARGPLLSPIVAFSHRDATASFPFTTLHITAPTRNTTALRATPGHLIRSSRGELVAMGALRIGDAVMLADGASGVVTAVRRVRGKGLYSPVTAHGDVVVDGVVASCYTTAVRADAAHALLAPVRAGFAAGTLGVPQVEWCAVFDWLRWAFW